MKQIEITDDLSERLDVVILHHFPNLSLGKLNKYLRENKIKVNGKKLPLSYKVKQGDTINLYLPYSLDEINKPHRLDIVYEDDCILIINKAAGMSVESSSSNSLISQVKEYLLSSSASADPILCHRLDTGTSGIVLIAKSQFICEQITSLIRNHEIKKEYFCVTFGYPQPENATLKAWLTKDASKSTVYVNKTESKSAKEIITKYNTIAVSGPFALLNVELITGRTHQIRAHMAYIGCPILGDSKYGVNSINRKYKYKYQALCAHKITFPLIETGELAHLSKKSFCVEKPWYYNHVINGILK